MNIVQKSYKFRIYPNKEQKTLLAKTFGCSRFVYNYFLARKRDSWQQHQQKLSRCDVSKELTLLKKNQSYTWLNEVPGTCLRQSLEDLDRAYQNWFRSLKTNRHFKYPKFKNKYAKKSTRFQDVVYRDGQLHLPKLGAIRVKWSQTITTGPKMATVSQSPSGKYYISFMIETAVNLKPLTGNHVGIDVGLKDFAILSTGEAIANPRYLKNKLKALRRSQRALSRSQKDSRRREQKRIKVAKLHEKIANTRNDFQHKLSLELVTKYDTIVVEKLQVKNMMQNGRLARSIADAAWSSFTIKLDYKCQWYGKTFVAVSPNYTSRDCSSCGHRHETKMTLDIRSWTCSNCGTTHDRDVNAAQNILRNGLFDLYDVYEIPKGIGELTDVDIISSGNSSCETSMDEASICGYYVLDKLRVCLAQ